MESPIAQVKKKGEKQEARREKNQGGFRCDDSGLRSGKHEAIVRIEAMCVGEAATVRSGADAQDWISPAIFFDGRLLSDSIYGIFCSTSVHATSPVLLCR